MDQQKVNFYLEEARAAVKYARDMLWVGMGNYMNDPDDPRYIARVRFMRMLGSISGLPAGEAIGYLVGKFGPEVVLLGGRLGSIPGEVGERLEQALKGTWNTPEGIKKYNGLLLEGARKTGETFRVGNCFEHAAACYFYLVQKGHRPRPVEVMETCDHAFVLVGRSGGSGKMPDTWGDEVVVADAYYNDVYHLHHGTLRPRQTNALITRGRVES